MFPLEFTPKVRADHSIVKSFQIFVACAPVRLKFSIQRIGAKAVSFLIIISMITLSTPAATESIRAMVGQTAQEIRFSFLSSSIVINYPKWLNAFFAAQSRGDDLTLNQVRIFPGDLTIRQGSEAVLTAVGFDSSGEPISGLAFNWSFTDTSRRTPTRHFSGGIFKGTRAGTFLVKAENSGFYDEVRITVRPITAEEMSFLAEDKKEGVRVSSRSGIEGKEGEKQALKNAPQINSLIGQGTWNDGNWLSADDPGNLPGNPPGGPMDDGAGNGNFQISAPVISLSGRGIDLALNLNYNSRVWNKSGNELTYDIDVGQPAPGWSLGFGKIVHMGQGGCMLIDADGTRHGYTGSINSWSNGMSFTGHTADGSFIDYGCWFNYGQYGGGWAKLPNGTEVVYSTIGPGNSHVYPTMITDVQGNYITITYRNPSNPQIEIIKDTMGRVVTFHYDQLNRLIEVRAPRMQDQDPIFGSGKTRTVMRLHYRPLTLNYSYAGGITPVVRQSTVQVIDAIYYPGTQTGYWFGDTDSYSTYGMITRVVEHRGMSWQAGSEEQGEVVPGTMTKQASYNYPLTTTNESGRTSGIGLSDAPTYTKLTESWAGRDVEEDAVTEYAINNNDWKFDGTSNSPARSITIIQPTGVISRQYSYRTPGTWTDGLVFTDETVVMNNQVEVIVARSLVSWQQGNGINYLNYDSPRPGWAKVFDENGHYVKTVYTYGTGRFNQITRSCDYDNSDTLLRCSSAEYENSAAYIGQFNGSGQFTGGRHIFNLVKSSRVENPDGSIASRTDYEYDNYTGNALRDTPGVIQHLHTHNPYTAETQQGNVCMLWSPQNGMCNYEGQEIWIAGDLYYCSCQEWNEVSVYDPATEKRGNVTKITTYSDANTSSGPIVETRSYDMTGNPVRISSACCEETSIEFSSAFQYAYPTSQTRGSANPQSPYRITTSSFYSFETGLVISSTDANGLISQTWYDPNTLRAVKTVSPTGAYTNFSYDDTAMTIEEEVREPDGWVQGPLAGKSKKYLNGIGQVRKEESFAPGGIVDIVEIKYTKYGEEWKQSRPYRAGDTVYWSEKFYDSQRRLVKVVEPDGSETRSFYNETQLPDSVSQKPGSRIRVVDAWGRERWGRYDQQGRLVEVVEPNPDRNVNPTGSVFTAGSLLTKYFYDTLGRLVQTEQGAQTRKFKYDSLGRLTRQKLAEQTATLNESGAFVGIGHQDAIWAEAFVYDNRSNLIQKTDPRGVRTNFSYQLSGGGVDPLNRLQSRSYDLSGPMQPNLTIHSAPAVTFEYMTTGDRTRIKKVRTQGFLTEEYIYDALSRVNEYKQTVDYRPNYPMSVNYLYDALDRVTEVYYPAQYGLTGSPRKTLANTYDKASRLSSLKIDGTEVAGNISYNASDQTTSIKIGPAGANQVTEEYTFDPQTGLLTNQKAVRGGQTLLDLSYDYSRGNSVGSLNGKTGHLTRVIDNLNNAKNREYEFDALGRLVKAKGGAGGALWNQRYSYDRYGNRTNVTATGVAADNSPIPMDGIPNLSYDSSSNRITTAGFEYDVAGNQTRALAEDGVTWLKFEYDAANRLSVVKKDDANQTLLQAFQYGSTNARLIDYDPAAGVNKFYASVGGTVMAEYTEYAQYVFTWTKSFTYLGDSLLSTVTPNGAGGEATEYNHPDRLGTRLITNQTLGTVSEQAHLPFGRPLNAESSLTTNNKRFTSYDRSAATDLDYAINRTYDSKLGRFTQVDPIGMQAISLASPQTLNMYAYCGNDPINHVDPAGLFFGKLFKWLFKAINKILKWVVIAVVAILVVAAIVYTAGGAMPAFLGGGNGLLGILGSIAGKIGAGISSFMAGAIGVEVGATVGGSIAAVLYGVGAIANQLAQTKDGKKKDGKKKKDKPNKYVVWAVNAARAILSGKNACSAWFGPNGLAALEDLAGQLNKTEGFPNDDKTGIRQEDFEANVQTPAGRFRRWKTVTVNTNGPFLNPRSTARIGNYPPGSRESRVTQILHEVAHKVPGAAGGGLIPDDGGNPKLSEQNTDEVLKHCRSEIEKIAKGK